ncbi:transposase, partial [Rubellimicrobium roseum]
MAASLLRLAGLNWPVPAHSTLCRRRQTVASQIPHVRSGGNLGLRVDSTGMEMRGGGEWQVHRQGPGRRREWRKVHLALDAATGDIRAVEATPSREGDSPVPLDLLMHPSRSAPSRPGRLRRPDLSQRHRRAVRHSHHPG